MFINAHTIEIITDIQHGREWDLCCTSMLQAVQPTQGNTGRGLLNEGQGGLLMLRKPWCRMLCMMHQPPPPPPRTPCIPCCSSRGTSSRCSPQQLPPCSAPTLARLLGLDDQRLAAHTRLEHGHTRALGDARVHVSELVHPADGRIFLAAL